MTPVSTSYALLLTFHNNLAHHKKTYCWPTRQQMIEGIERIKGRLYSKSWIDDNLGNLKRNKFIVSYRNWGRYDDGTVFNKASNRQLTIKALYVLKKTGCNVAKWLWGTAKKITKPLDLSPATRENPPPAKEEPPRKTGVNPFLDPGHRRRLGLPGALPFDPKKA